MSEFTASNGVTVHYVVAIDGTARLLGTSPRPSGGEWTEATASPEGIEALREFFRAEEDKRLGRWRWAENPEYVVYPGPGEMREALVISEVHGCWGSWSETEAIREGGYDTLAAAAVAYFDAHPNPKPWHDAKDGETWVLTVNGVEGAWAFRNREWERVSDGY